MSDEKETTLRISERGAARIQEMAQHVSKMASYYGDETCVRVARSFADAVGNIVRLGGDIWSEGPDGDLSLGGRTERGLTYGVVAFPFPAESPFPDAPTPVEWSIHS